MTKSKPDYVDCDACKFSPICSPINVGTKTYNFTFEKVNRRHFFKRGEVIFKQGDPASLICAISAGSLKLIVNIKETERVIDFRIPGELVDMSSFNAGIHSYSAQALEDTYLCEISKETLNDIASQIPEVQERVMSMIGHELNSVQKSSILLHGNVNAEEKIAAFILNIAWRYKISGYPYTEFKLTMSRTDIADFLGLAKETVIRILKKLQQNGLISIQGKNIALNNIDALQKFVGIDLIDS
jgi:CRP/FNR family transcriptional regulator, anaerobic regulatory protein